MTTPLDGDPFIEEVVDPEETGTEFRAPLPVNPPIEIEPREPGTQIRITGIPFRFTGRLLDKLQNESAGTRLAFSIRKIYSRYAGPAFRVRRSLDNQEIDIGFNGTFLEEDELLRFVTGTTEDTTGTLMGYITRWYDQSGNGDDAIQPDPLFQPIIVENNRIVRDILGNVAIKFQGRFLDTTWEPTIDDIVSGAGMTMVAAPGAGRQGQTGAIYLVEDVNKVIKKTFPDNPEDPRIPGGNGILRLETTPYPRALPDKMAYVGKNNNIILYDYETKTYDDTGVSAPVGSALLTFDTHVIESNAVPASDRARGWKASVWASNEKLYLIPYDSDRVLVIDPNSGASNPISSVVLPTDTNLPKQPNGITGLVGWYTGDSWIPGTGWRNEATGSVDVAVGTDNVMGAIQQSEGAGMAGSTDKYVFGGVDDGVRFPTSVLDDSWGEDYTLFHVCRYNGTTRGRIVNGQNKNWLSGFWASRTAQCYHGGGGEDDINAWVSRVSADTTDTVFGDDWVISTDQNDLYRGNAETMDMSRLKNPKQSARIGLNMGPYMPGDASDWACAELITFNRKLSDAEITEVEAYLMNKYGPRSRYEDAVLASDGRIYAVPSTVGNVLVIDPSTDTVSLHLVPGYTPRSLGWRTLVADTKGGSNCLFGIPHNADQVLQIQTGTNPVVSLIGPSYDGFAKWNGGAQPDTTENYVYGIPSDAGTILRITPLAAPATSEVTIMGNTGTRIDPVPIFLHEGEGYKWVSGSAPSLGTGYEVQAPRLRVSHDGNPKNNGLPYDLDDISQWTVNSDGSVSTTKNSNTVIGLINAPDSALENYEFTCRLGTTSPSNDNDLIGFFIAFVEDPDDPVKNNAYENGGSVDYSLDTTSEQIPMQHTLSVWRHRTYQGFGVPNSNQFFVAYNFNMDGVGERFWLSAEVPVPENHPFPNSVVNKTDAPYGANKPTCRLRVRREGNLVEVWTSNWTDVLNDGEYPNNWNQWIGPITVNLADPNIPELHRFQGPQRWGYGSWSQTHATHTNTVLRDLDGNPIAFDPPYEFRPSIQFPPPDPVPISIQAYYDPAYDPGDANIPTSRVYKEDPMNPIGDNDWDSISGLFDAPQRTHEMVFPSGNRYVIDSITSGYIDLVVDPDPSDNIKDGGTVQILEIGTFSIQVYYDPDELDEVPFEREKYRVLKKENDWTSISGLVDKPKRSYVMVFPSGNRYVIDSFSANHIDLLVVPESIDNETVQILPIGTTTANSRPYLMLDGLEITNPGKGYVTKPDENYYTNWSQARFFRRPQHTLIMAPSTTTDENGVVHGMGLQLGEYRIHERGLSTEAWDYRPRIQLGRGNDPVFGTILIYAALGSIATVDVLDGGDGFFARPELTVIGGDQIGDGSESAVLEAVMAYVDEEDENGNPIELDLTDNPTYNPVSGTFDPNMPRPGWPAHPDNDDYWLSKGGFPSTLTYPVGREMRIVRVKIAQGGQGYTNSRSIQVVVDRNRDREDATVSASHTESRFVKFVSVLNGGSGYGPDTKVVISGPTPNASDRVTARARPIIENGVIRSIEVTHSGRNYSNALPTVTFTDTGGGSGASAICVLLKEAYIDNITKFDRPIPTGYVRTPPTDSVTTVTPPSRIVDLALDKDHPARLCLRNEAPGEFIGGFFTSSAHAHLSGRNKWTGGFVNSSGTHVFAIPSNTCRVFCMNASSETILDENRTRVNQSDPNQDSPMPGGLFGSHWLGVGGWSGGVRVPAAGPHEDDVVYCWPQYPTRTLNGFRNTSILKFGLNPTGRVSVSPTSIADPVVDGTYVSKGRSVFLAPENGIQMFSIRTPEDDRLEIVRSGNTDLTSSMMLTPFSDDRFFGTSRNGFQSRVLEVNTGSTDAATLPPPRVEITISTENGDEQYLVFGPDRAGKVRRIRLDGTTHTETTLQISESLPTYTDATVLLDGVTVAFIPTYNPYDSYDYTQGRTGDDANVLTAPILLVNASEFTTWSLRTSVSGTVPSGSPRDAPESGETKTYRGGGVPVAILPPLGSRSACTMQTVDRTNGIFNNNTLTWVPEVSDDLRPVVVYTIELDANIDDTFALPDEDVDQYNGKRPMKRLTNAVQNVLQDGQTLAGTTYFEDGLNVVDFFNAHGTWDVTYDSIRRKMFTCPGIEPSFFYLDPFQWRDAVGNPTLREIELPTVGTSRMKWDPRWNQAGHNLNYRTITYGANENVYMIPYNGDVVYEINAQNFADNVTTNPVSTIQVFGMVTGGGRKFWGGVPASNRRTFCVPYNSDVILVLDPDQDNPTARILELDLPESVRTATPESKYAHGVEATNGMLYFLPHSARRVLEVDPSGLRPSCREVGPDLGSGPLKSYGGVLGSNGWIYTAPGAGGVCLVIDPTQRDLSQTDGMDIRVYSVKHPSIPSTTSIGAHPSWSKPMMARNERIYMLPVTAPNALILQPEYGNEQKIRNATSIDPLDFFRVRTFGNFDEIMSAWASRYKYYATASADNGLLYGIGRLPWEHVEVTPEMDYASVTYFRQSNYVEWISGPPLFNVFKLRPFVIWDENWAEQSKTRVYLHTANGYGLLNVEQAANFRFLTFTQAIRISNGYAGLEKPDNVDENFTMITPQGIIKVEGNRGGFFGVRPSNGCDLYNFIDVSTMISGIGAVDSQVTYSSMFSQVLAPRTLDGGAVYNDTGILASTGQDPSETLIPQIRLFVGNVDIGQGTNPFRVGEFVLLSNVTVARDAAQFTTLSDLSSYAGEFVDQGVRFEVRFDDSGQQIRVTGINASAGTVTLADAYTGEGYAGNSSDVSLVRLADSKTPFSIGRVQGYGTSGNAIPNNLPDNFGELFLTSQYTGLLSEAVVITKDISRNIEDFVRNQSFYYGVNIR